MRKLVRGFRLFIGLLLVFLMLTGCNKPQPEKLTTQSQSEQTQTTVQITQTTNAPAIAPSDSKDQVSDPSDTPQTEIPSTSVEPTVGQEPTTTTATPTTTTLKPATTTTSKPAATSTTPAVSTPVTTNLIPNVYKSKLQLFQMNYPTKYTINEADSYTVMITDTNRGISILVDKLPVSLTPEAYFEQVAAAKKKQLPTWSATNVTDIVENGVVIGFKYDYTNEVNGRNWIGKAIAIKKAGFGFYVVFTTPETEWASYQEIAVQCLEKFTIAKIYSGEYSNQELGIALTLPLNWSVVETGDSKIPLKFYQPYNQQYIVGDFHIGSVSEGTSAQQWAANLAINLNSDDGGTQVPFKFVNSIEGYEFSDLLANNGVIVAKFRYIGMVIGTRVYYFLFMASVSTMDAQFTTISQLAQSLVISGQ